MKKSLFLVVVLCLILAACNAAPINISTSNPTSSPCELVMTEETFARRYEGKEVVFMGSYSNGVVLAFEVDGVIFCTHNFNEEVASIPTFSQDTIVENGEKWQDIIPIIDERSNLLIGSSGILGYETYPDGGMIDLTIHNTSPIQIYSKPDKCIELNGSTVQKFDNVSILVVGAAIDENGWTSLYFQSKGETYCYEKAYVILVMPVTDIFGKTVYTNSGGLGNGVLNLFMNLQGTVHFYDDQTVSTGAAQFAPNDKQKIVFIQTGEIQNYNGENYDNPKLFEVLSHSSTSASGIDYLDWNVSKGKYKLINSTDKPLAVNSGYIYTPKQYLDGGEIKVGTVLGIANSNPVEVTEIVCALGGMSLVPVYSISYSGSDGSSYILTDPDSYLYFVENEGDGQEITYYHVPTLAEECPTSY